MNVKMLSDKIKALEEKVERLESWRLPHTSTDVILDQIVADDAIRDLARARQVLKRTSGIISKKRAADWLKDIEHSRSSWA